MTGIAVGGRSILHTGYDRNSSNIPDSAIYRSLHNKILHYRTGQDRTGRGIGGSGSLGFTSRTSRGRPSSA